MILVERQESMSVIFISYSHQDEELKNQLIRQLMVLEREGLLEIWIDDKISAGEAWDSAINDALLQADIAILLITSNFLTSNFILKTEVPVLLKRRKAGAVSLFPIISRPCAWQEVSWLAELNVRPKNGEPIWGKDNETADRYLAEITREVANIVKNPGGVDLNTSYDISSFEEKFYQSLSSGFPLMPSEIQQMITDAIAIGAPAYNEGNIRICFEIYHYTARRLLTQLLVKEVKMHVSGLRIDGVEYSKEKEWFMPRGYPMGMPLTFRTREESNQTLFNAVIHDLRTTLEQIDDTKELDIDKAAWNLRYCFDRIVLLIRSKQD